MHDVHGSYGMTPLAFHQVELLLHAAVGNNKLAAWEDYSRKFDSRPLGGFWLVSFHDGRLATFLCLPGLSETGQAR